MTLFDDMETIRTLAFYQPFCSLMLHGKTETRWVRVGKKPPFIIGKYLFYSTKQSCSNVQLFEWCGPELMALITETLKNDPTRSLEGYALAIGELGSISPMKLNQQHECFVKYQGIQLRKDKEGVVHEYRQQCLMFSVRAIEPFKFEFGKQGVGKLPASEYSKIKYLA